MQQSFATPKNQDVGIGLRKIVAYPPSDLHLTCNQQGRGGHLDLHKGKHSILVHLQLAASLYRVEEKNLRDFSFTVALLLYQPHLHSSPMK